MRVWCIVALQKVWHRSLSRNALALGLSGRPPASSGHAHSVGGWGDTEAYAVAVCRGSPSCVRRRVVRQVRVSHVTRGTLFVLICKDNLLRVHKSCWGSGYFMTHPRSPNSEYTSTTYARTMNMRMKRGRRLPGARRLPAARLLELGESQREGHGLPGCRRSRSPAALVRCRALQCAMANGERINMCVANTPHTQTHTPHTDRGQGG